MKEIPSVSRGSEVHKWIFAKGSRDFVKRGVRVGKFAISKGFYTYLGKIRVSESKALGKQSTGATKTR